jgi:hypothetical protein
MRASPRQPSPASARGKSAAHLEDMEWPVAFSVMAYGVRISVRVTDSRIAADLTHHLPPGWQRLDFCDTGRVYSLLLDAEADSGEPRGSLYVNRGVLARRVAIPTLLRAFEADVQLHVAEMAPERVFVHAGVVGYRGRTILLPGRSFAGKTTLVAALVRSGADYFSDEYAVLDAAGAVHPYARPLAIRRAGVPGVTKCSVDTLGGQLGNGPLPVGLVVVCRFRSGSDWRPQPLSPGRGIQALLANTVAARRIPETVMATLHQVVSVAPVITSDRGEAASVVEPILNLALWG